MGRAAVLRRLLVGRARRRAGPPPLDSANYSPPRLPSGKPDLQGLWSNAVVTPLERPADLADKAFLTEEEAREYTARRVETTNRDSRPDDADADILLAYNDFWWDSGNSVVRTLRTSLIVDPPNGKIPELTEAAKQRVAATRPPSADGPETQGLSTRCIYYATAGPPMLPGSYNNHYQLVQTDDHVLIVNEMVHETRIIPLDGRPFPPDEIRQWRGSSRGSLGRRYVGRRDEEPARRYAVSRLEREHAVDRALHARRRRRAALRVHRRRSRGVHAAVDRADPVAARRRTS